MSRFLMSTAAAGALMAMLAAPIAAQEGQPTPATPAPAAQSVTLPQLLRDAGMTDVKGTPSRNGTRIEGRLADGTAIGAFLDESGGLRGLRAEGKDAVLPPALIQGLVPEAVRSRETFADLSRIDAVFLGGRGITLSGLDGQSNSVRAVFAEDGTLLRFGRDDQDRDAGMDHDGGNHDNKDKDKEKGKDHKDPKGKKHGDNDDDDDNEGPRGDHGPRGDGPRGQAPEGPAPTLDEVRSSLTNAGYTGIGQILQQGHITVAQATNPEGEPVLVELGTGAKVLRELNR